MGVKENVRNIRERIKTAARQGGYDPETVKIVAVIKNVSLDLVYQALEAGITDIGENKVQEAEGRWQQIKEKFPQIKIHFIGHLQRNKVRQSLDMFDIIQSIDSSRLLKEIEARAERPVPVLIEVNTSGETSKFGIEVEKAPELVQLASSIKNIRVQGLMTMGPLTGDPEISRGCFKRLKELKEKIEGSGISLPQLSMGMSGDYSVAVEEGSNIVRIGRAIFASQ